MTLKEFNPTGSTGPLGTDMLYREDITGPQGSRFTLFQERQHTKEDINSAKKYLKQNFDVVKIYIVKETY